MARNFKDLGIKVVPTTFVGEKIKISKILNLEILVHKYKLEESKQFRGTDCLYLQIELNGTDHLVTSGSRYLIEAVKQVEPHDFPFSAKIIEEQNKSYQFS